MTLHTRRDIFQAIADPTRRAIIDLVATKPQNLQSIAGHFEISRPAISQQIKILVECGVVVVTRQGRETYCSANLRPLHQVSDWMDKHRKLWEGRFDAIDRIFEEKKKSARTHNRKRPKH